MSCDGCIYNTKQAGCDYSYPCNTTGKPIAKQESMENKDKNNKKKNRKDAQVAKKVVPECVAS